MQFTETCARYAGKNFDFFLRLLIFYAPAREHQVDPQYQNACKDKQMQRLK